MLVLWLWKGFNFHKISAEKRILKIRPKLTKLERNTNKYVDKTYSLFSIKLTLHETKPIKKRLNPNHDFNIWRIKPLQAPCDVWISLQALPWNGFREFWKRKNGKLIWYVCGLHFGQIIIIAFLYPWIDFGQVCFIISSFWLFFYLSSYLKWAYQTTKDFCTLPDISELSRVVNLGIVQKLQGWPKYVKIENFTMQNYWLLVNGHSISGKIENASKTNTLHNSTFPTTILTNYLITLVFLINVLHAY